ncbi:ATP-binding mismatch repair protein [Malassezia cuniculi]|uniref:ATP-binding mismatch repair protein n=1 Tax=Malassezia cuniculi TaxID=948313 RepID=A0AAF0EZC7_9BASI|nr:ATP-binding mismatch repair protein [Malassezia cuniculi]
MRIAPLAAADVRRLTGAQVVLDLRSVVKELIENALDAGATAIEVQFKGHGAEAVQVSDNGHGIQPADYASLALRHHTSKLESFEDLDGVTTYGFRGEALAAMCAVGTLVMTTATREQAPVATVLEFESSGALKSADKKAARAHGTTAVVSDLFAKLPVRRRELEKHVRREYAKAHALIQAYALITAGVRWETSLVNSGKKQSQLVVQASSGDSHVMANVKALFGARAAGTLTQLALDVADVHATVTGMISRPSAGSGRSSGDRQFFYINGRPWEAPRVARIFNDVYRQYNALQVPFVVADFRLPTDAYDVNVTPDKRTVYVHNEDILLDGLRDALDAFFAPSRGVFEMHGPRLQDVAKHILQQEAATQEAGGSEHMSGGAQDVGRAEAHVRGAPSEALVDDQPAADAVSDEAAGDMVDEPFDDACAAIDDAQAAMDEARTRDLDDSERVQQGDYGDFAASASERDSTGSHTCADEELDSPEPQMNTAEPESPSGHIVAAAEPESPSGHIVAAAEPDSPNSYSCASENESDPPHTSEDAGVSRQPAPHTRTARVPTVSTRSATWSQESRTRDNHSSLQTQFRQAVERFASSQSQECLELARDLEYAESDAESDDAAESAHDSPPPSKRRNVHSDTPEIVRTQTTPIGTLHVDLSVMPTQTPRRPRGPADISLSAAGIGSEHAEATLERVIEKGDFGEMEVIGQFNRGFIIVRRRVRGMDDLFIIDQHAADEKYNFEMLQQHAKLQTQQLIQPQVVELAPADELVAAEHITQLRASGFVVTLDDDAQPGRRLRLHALPASRDTVYGVADLEELLAALRDAPRATRVHCSKTRAIFASRACRKSIMIGAALEPSRMRTVWSVEMSMHDRDWRAALAAGDALDALRDALFAAAEEHVRIASHTQRTGTAVAELDRALARVDVAAARAAARVDTTAYIRGNQAAKEVAAAIQNEWNVVADEMDRIYELLSGAKLAMVVHDLSAQCQSMLDALEKAVDAAERGAHDSLAAATQHLPACVRMVEVLSTTDPENDASERHYARLRALQGRLRAMELPHTPRLGTSSTTPQGTPQSPHFHPGAATPRQLPTPRSARKRTSMLPIPSMDAPRSPGVPSTPTFGMPRAPAPAPAPPSLGTPRTVATPTLGARTPPWGTPRSAPASPGRRRVGRLRDDTQAPPLPGAAAGGLYIPDPRDALDVAVARICNARRIHISRVDSREEYNRYELLGKTVACRLLLI